MIFFLHILVYTYASARKIMSILVDQNLPIDTHTVQLKRTRKPRTKRPVSEPINIPAQQLVQQPVQPIKVRKPRGPPKPPTEKQIASRAVFRENVNKAKQLQASEPGLTYKAAIKKVYTKSDAPAPQ